MPLTSPPDGLTAKQADKLRAHLTSDPELSGLLDLPILSYPPDGMPATHPERCLALWYLDSDDGYFDNASNKNENVFTIRLKIREASTSFADIALAHRQAQNMKDILTQALWRYRKDDCTAPPALWYKMQFASPSARVWRDAEKGIQCVEIGFKIFAATLNRPY